MSGGNDSDKDSFKHLLWLVVREVELLQVLTLQDVLKIGVGWAFKQVSVTCGAVTLLRFRCL